MEALQEQPIGQIVADDYRTSSVFNKHGIDFCCGGEKSIEEVCANNEVDLDTLVHELQNLQEEGAREDNYNNWSLDFLVDYIINNHHNKTRELLPELKFYAGKVAMVHGQSHEELIAINEVVNELSEEMMSHMDEEEEKLFPFIKKMVAGELAEQEKNNSAEVIAMMQDEHDETGDMMKKIRSLSSDYTLPEDACNTYTVYFKNLEGFEEELFKHVHLENNILFPKALKLMN